MTQHSQDKAKKDSVEVFGRENLSGYLQVLIQKGLQNNNRENKK